MCRECGGPKPPGKGRKLCDPCRVEARRREKEYARHYGRNRYLAKREEIIARSQRWAERNPQRRKEIARAWYERNRKECNEAARAWYQANKDYAKAYIYAWQRAHPERRREYEHRRKARIRSTAPLPDETIVARLAYWGFRCWMCGSEGAPEIDHVKPLSKGGAHIAANLRPACKSCNSRKGDRWPYTARADT